MEVDKNVTDENIENDGASAEDVEAEASTLRSMPRPNRKKKLP